MPLEMWSSAPDRVSQYRVSGSAPIIIRPSVDTQSYSGLHAAVPRMPPVKMLAVRRRESGADEGAAEIAVRRGLRQCRALPDPGDDPVLVHRQPALEPVVNPVDGHDQRVMEDGLTHPGTTSLSSAGPRRHTAATPATPDYAMDAVFRRRYCRSSPCFVREVVSRPRAPTTPSNSSGRS